MTEPGRDGLLPHLDAYRAALDAEIGSRARSNACAATCLQGAPAIFLRASPGSASLPRSWSPACSAAQSTSCFPQQAADTFDVAVVDPLYAVDGSGDAMSGPTAFLRRRWPAVALVASLVLNGFFVGMFVVDAVKHHRRGLSGERLATFELRRFDERLPPAAVDKIAGELKPLGPELEDRLKAMREIRAEIMRLAAAPRARPRRSRRAACRASRRRLRHAGGGAEGDL